MTRTLPAHDTTALDDAAGILSRGGLVAVPTETVYGLAADAMRGEAVARIYEAKGRPRFNPLIVHVDSLARAEQLIELNQTGRRLAAAFWPGPLTLVAPLRADAGVADLVTAGLETLAVRWPDSEALTGLVARLDRPLAAPSANRSGAVSPTRAAHVLESLGGRIDLILDGGPCRVGLESTIVDVTGAQPVLLRPGGVTRAALETVCGPLASASPAPDRPSAPGQLSSHYAPKAPVRLNATRHHPGEGFLAFGKPPEGVGFDVINLSERSDLAEAAERLFSALRRLDERFSAIAVAPIPDEGLGEAINDRLRRAAADRTNTR
ncbi:threonylcarbamoyl-AMP synthase [Alkalicaulis satelles]|uniref:Threonylcarbamoyl-AMP synthase n=1 Tax=Alkalicaulis satelles TaxID=2609175 RepID=A0A5M6ZIC1_9PROT|nr:L-threonylcarbamoyladenylate synthase [Alkalicaulis satelles]KAA5804582.1 threonylcarbamoyl-AMP synthase [Alkalicaulis satelles]